MQLDSEDLLAQVRADWPAELELSQLRLLVTRQAEALQDRDEQIARMRAQLDRLVPPADSTSFASSAVRPYIPADPLGDEGSRHG